MKRLGNKISLSSNCLVYCFSQLTSRGIFFSFLFIVRRQHNRIMNDPPVSFLCPPPSQCRPVDRALRGSFFDFCWNAWHECRLMHDLHFGWHTNQRPGDVTELWCISTVNISLFRVITRFQGEMRCLLTEQIYGAIDMALGTRRSQSALISYWGFNSFWIWLQLNSLLLGFLSFEIICDLDKAARWLLHNVLGSVARPS